MTVILGVVHSLSAPERKGVWQARGTEDVPTVGKHQAACSSLWGRVQVTATVQSVLLPLLDGKRDLGVDWLPLVAEK